MNQDLHRPSRSPMTRSTDRATIVSADTHVGPQLATQLREYCPKAYLEAYDSYVAQDRIYRERLREAAPEYYEEIEPGVYARAYRNFGTAGHYDVDARLRDMDFDGIAAEVIFHGSVNDEPLPFADMGDPRHAATFKNLLPSDPELAAVGRRIYNRWLADMCSVQPERHVGLAQLPIWDLEASIVEIEWAREAGLRGLNFPAYQTWLPQYNKPEWEPFWSAAAAAEMPLTTHFGVAGDADYSGIDGLAVSTFEIPVIFGRRVLPWMVFSGVFERHPQLRYVITEMPGAWWSDVLSDMDSSYRFIDNRPMVGDRDAVRLTDVCPRPPSEYCRDQVFVGASFMNRIEAEAASADGSYTNMMWGSDYPHAEGTFHLPDSYDEVPLTQQALRFAMAGLPTEEVASMVGRTAATVYGLDLAALEEVAARIDAPTFADLSIPYTPPPDDRIKSLAFRSRGLWD